MSPFRTDSVPAALPRLALGGAGVGLLVKDLDVATIARASPPDRFDAPRARHHPQPEHVRLGEEQPVAQFAHLAEADWYRLWFVGAASWGNSMILAEVERDLVEWVLIALTAIGVGIAIWQSWKSGRIASSAEKAMHRAESHLQGSQLLSIGPQLEALESELMAAVREGKSEETVDLLIRWRQQANELVGLFESRENEDDEDVENAFRKVASDATLAQTRLADGEAEVRPSTKAVRAAISEAVGSMARYAGKLKNAAPRET